jgi:hypothetical protein
VEFEWSTGSQVGWYWLWIGTAPNQSDLVNKSMGLETSLTVTQLPVNGRPLYVTLFSYLEGSWHSYNYTYATAGSSAIAQMITPVDGSTFPGSTVIFNWSSAPGAQEYWLYIGSRAGASDLFTRSAGLNTSFTISNLPTSGQTVFVTLWTQLAGQWKTASYRYVTGSGSVVQVAPGLHYDYYEQAGMTVVPDFSKLTAVASGTIDNFDLTPRKRDEWFAVRFTGYVRVDVAGDYTFSTASDDGSNVFIDGKLLVNDDGVHGWQEKSATTNLTQGYHAITVTYFQTYGGFSLDVNWTGPGLTKQHVANGQLFHAVSN